LPALSPTLVAGLVQFTRALNFVTNTFDLLLLDHSLEYFTHSTKLALIKAIASLQQSTHKAKCTLNTVAHPLRNCVDHLAAPSHIYATPRVEPGQ